ncbi:hypothetical protein [Pedobacter montanisoli]|uniref:Transporter n=1 Tax=Pedobacter montanisoli TaxID=2923277 RepID=A0ABS9ZT49_9SPHI|nr:hypothetical protein [Pedobacter montanisoli]MCJ0741775.1 hypothetical protein [Pedobacter montanisoli]
MRKGILILLVALLTSLSAIAQELYIYSEPASNMPKKSIGVRLTTEGTINPKFTNRIMPEVMFGLNKNLMFHLQGFASDTKGKYAVEGGSVYAKYRFLSLDEAQSHFRGAVFGRVSTSNLPIATEDINLEGDNSGWQAGVIFTQLLHKLALSGTVGYNQAFNVKSKQVAGMPSPDKMINYSLSSGYLLLPFVYKNYQQPNFNLYFEVLGKTNPENGNSYLDFAPAVQFIFNSRTRIDLGYRFQVAGDMQNRYLKNMYLARLELNFFNVLK